MDTFDEWVKAAEQHPCLQLWGDKIVALGASWDSFRRDKQEITEDLVQGGIPILAARDIVDIASKEVKRTTSPMAIFWDLENMPIPAGVSGRDIVGSLKTILAPHGDLRQFRGYASIGLNLIPQEKRSDLQLSGCHLVDCPHSGRKEVADKMIIVDAMQFAFQHPDGATLCFITGDVDYAYLLAVLQRHPEWRTIVISRGTMQSMLHVNCHMKMRWETDILMPIFASTIEAEGKDLTDEDGVLAMTVDCSDTSEKAQDGRFAPLTGDEFWRDDIELLRSVIIQEGRRFKTNAPRKSQVGNTLRQTNPARFPNRDTIRSFFMKAIEKGVVTERGEGPFKTLVLSDRRRKFPREVEHDPICSVCSSRFQDEEGLAALSKDGQHFCSPECNVWSVQGEDVKKNAVDCTVQALQFMAENDDIYVGEAILRKILYSRHHDLCSGPKYMRLWIQEAIMAGKVVTFQRFKSSSMLVCLREYYEEALQEFPPDDFDTTKEEKFLHQLMLSLDNVGGLNRRDIAKELQENFPDKMDTCFRRNKALLNAQTNGLIYLCKGPFVHVVGLTKEQAKAAMRIEEQKVQDRVQAALGSGGDYAMRASIIAERKTPGDNDEDDSTANSSTSRSNTFPSTFYLPVSPSGHSAASPGSKVSASSIPKNNSEPSKKSTVFNRLVDSKGNSASPNLHVKGFGPETTKTDVLKAFQKYVNVKEVVVKDHFGHCFMFVNTTSLAGAIEARQQLHGSELNGGVLHINFAK